MKSFILKNKVQKPSCHCLVAVLALVAAPCFAEEDPKSADHPNAPLGRWRGRVVFGQYPVEVTLSFARGPKGGLVGQWTSGRYSTPLRLVSYKNGRLTFLREGGAPRGPNGGRVPEMDFSGEIRGNRLTGAFFVSNNTIEFNARRVRETPAAPTDDDRPATPPRLVGAWVGHLGAEPEPRALRLVIGADNNGLLITDERTLPILTLRLDGDRLLVAVRVETPQKPRTINLELTLEDTKLTGEAYFSDNADRTLGNVILVKKKPEH
ncbi:MAG: hypothetical protein ACYTGQ_11910 [Planctomycetota bacterium]|jgi:hypothetical protein